jgi:hypothetical protein
MNARNKGNAYERAIRKELRERFYPNCETSRYGSKYADDVLKTDLINTGFLSIQCKATEKAPNFQEVLSTMPNDDKYNLIFHKRNRMGEVVVMSKCDFYELLAMIKNNGTKI